MLADEAQDFSAPELKLLRAMVAPGPDDLFLVGDGHQRIYGQPVAMSRCGIDIIGRSRRLRLNYRTTDLIARQAARILAGLRIDDGEGGEESLQGVHSLRKGLAPSIRTTPPPVRVTSPSTCTKPLSPSISTPGPPAPVSSLTKSRVAVPLAEPVNAMPEMMPEAAKAGPAANNDRTAAASRLRREASTRGITETFRAEWTVASN